MRLPSLHYLSQKALEGFRLFPLSILSGIAASSVAIYLVEYEKDIENFFPYVNFLLTAALGIPLYFCVSILIRHYSFNRSTASIAWVASTVFLLLIYFSLPDEESTHNTTIPYVRYAIFNVIIHLLVAIIPYIKGHHLNGFWNYNKLLFLRILTSLLYSGFLYVGLCLAILSLDLLFDVEIEGKIYFELYIWVQGVFNTWFFVAGIPKDLKPQDAIYEYPRGLKIFTQYILMPLLILYLIILYAYGLKIVGLWDWPRGIVAYLITCVSVLGILCLLLMYPYSQSDKGNEWMQRFSKFYYYALIPLIALLFLAIHIRIADYGLTINRYLLVLMGIWLSIVSIYFMIGRSNIKFIPISLAAILLLCSFGPWGVFSWSERSQVNRLKYYWETYGVLKDEQIQNEVMWNLDSLPDFYTSKELTNNHLMPDSIHNEVLSIMEYLDENHGMKAIRSWYTQNLDSMAWVHEKENKYGKNEADLYLESAGIEPYHRYKSDYIYYDFDCSEKEIINIEGYDHMLFFQDNFYNKTGKTHSYQVADTLINVSIDQSVGEGVVIQFNDRKDSISLSKKTNELRNNYGENYAKVPLKEMTIDYENEGMRYRLIINQLRMNGEGEEVEISYLDFSLMWRNTN
ncbi:DUF4153 domain-containing protein [Reichenbachiella ulvae]|uniref:DUF4153 domain-containing protein n=1 Tax=Reichenbachiella ulvae TaxID=2980104 RepID=A0ABT3CXQ1_9BACT|nr:DUF4153 domain-containing protein [Reichenbachiella ulvae]MCV9388379.1 DUF4153 domain-containing protein [Reichenbachiella ulvae]